MTQNVLYLLFLLSCLVSTWTLWIGSSGPDAFHVYTTYAFLWIAVSLSDKVPFARPRPNIAAVSVVVVWGIGLTHAAFSAAYAGELATFALIAIPPVLFLPLVLRRGLKQRVRTRRWIGAALVIGALLMGVDLLTATGIPDGQSKGIGLTASGVKYGTPGLAVHLDVYPGGCRSVVASLEVFGSREFWKHAGLGHRRSRIQMVLPADSARDVTVEAVTNPNAAFEDTLPESDQNSPFPLLRNGHVEIVPVHPLKFHAGLISVVRSGDYEVVNAWVGREWARTRAPVRFWFDPSWLTSSGLQRCYLQTPALLGPALWPLDTSPIWKDINSRHLALPAIGAVTVHNAEYTSGPSRPIPSNGDADSLTWTCGEDVSEVIQTPERKVPTYPLEWYRDKPSLSCAETTPLEEQTAATFNDLVVFLVGGLVSLGLTMIVIPGSSESR